MTPLDPSVRSTFSNQKLESTNSLIISITMHIDQSCLRLINVLCVFQERNERYLLLFAHTLLILSPSPRMSGFIYQVHTHTHTRTRIIFLSIQ